MALRIVVLGKTGYGKSALGNTLLGEKVFVSEGSFESITPKCQFGEKSVNGRDVSVTDTPGLCDTLQKKEDIVKEIAKAVGVSCPGPHAIIMVLRCDVRFTDAEFEAVQRLKAIFGDKISEYLMVVFTHGDHFDVENDQMQGVLEKYLKTAPRNLKTVLEWANNRYCVVNNRGSAESKKYFQEVVLNAILDKVMKPNGARHFTNEMIDKCQLEVEVAIAKLMNTKNISYNEASSRVRMGLILESMTILLGKLIFIVSPVVLLVLAVVTCAALFLCSVM